MSANPALATPPQSPSVSREDRYREIMRRHIDDENFVRQHMVFARRMNILRTLFHYELFKMVRDVPGDIVECGVYQGESLLNFARFMETFNTGDRLRRVIGFDHFKGLQDITAEDRGDPKQGNHEGGWNPEHFHPSLMELIDLFHEDSFVPSRPRISIVEGDIRETSKRYVEEDDPGLRIALLHLDCDLYEPTLASLEAFYPRVVTGGVVVFDEYAFAGWPGESKAVDEYFDGKPPRMKKFEQFPQPGGYFIKE